MTANNRLYESLCRGSSGTSRSMLSIAAYVFLLLIAAPIAIVFAASTVGSFEIDGNLNVDHLVPPLEPIDWESTPFPAALTTFTDATGQTDDIFGQGSKENDQSTWICTSGSAPAK